MKFFNRTARDRIMWSFSKVSVSGLLTWTTLCVEGSYAGPAVTRSRYLLWSEGPLDGSSVMLTQYVFSVSDLNNQE